MSAQLLGGTILNLVWFDINIVTSKIKNKKTKACDSYNDRLCHPFFLFKIYLSLPILFLFGHYFGCDKKPYRKTVASLSIGSLILYCELISGKGAGYCTGQMLTESTCN